MKKRIVLLLLVVVVGAGIVYYKKWRNEFVRKKIPELVFLQSDSLYRITYDDVDIDEIDGEILIKNLQLRPDTTFKKSNDPALPRNLLQVTVPEIHITGVQTNDAVLNKEVIASKIKLTNPVVTMFSNHHVPKKGDTTPTKDKIYEVLLRGLEKIKVDTILITDAYYHICRWPTGDTVFSGSTINAQLYELNISDSTSTDTSRVLFAKRAQLDIKKMSFRGKKPFYHYHFNNIEINSVEKLFSVKNISIIPRLGEAAFMRAAKWQTDRLDFVFSDLRFKQVNVQELLNCNLIADELSIKNAQFKIFRDKSYPDKNESRLGHYPHQEFIKIPVDVFLKKVVIQHGYIEYKEKNPQTTGSGTVSFHDVQATLYNVTNRTANLRDNSVCTLNFHSRFLDKVSLSATLKFYLNDSHGKFTVDGTMGSADATLYNLLSKPMALVQINSGTVNRLDFHLTCTDRIGKGRVRLLYDDLKIKLLKMDDPGSEFQVKKVASFLANMSIINSNPIKNQPVRVATVSHPRNIYASMFNLTWKSIFEGVQKTVGLDGKIK